MPLDIDRMKLRQTLYECFTRAGRQAVMSAQRQWDFAPDHYSAAAFHHKERRSDDRRIFAHQIYSRRRRKTGADGTQYPELPRHIVRFRGHRTQRRPPQNILALTAPQEIGQVRVSAGELLDLEPIAHALHLAAQIAAQRSGVQFLPRSHRGRIRCFHHVASFVISPIMVVL
jgi:hypothetical protein